MRITALACFVLACGSQGPQRETCEAQRQLQLFTGSKDDKIASIERSLAIIDRCLAAGSTEPVLRRALQRQRQDLVEEIELSRGPIKFDGMCGNPLSRGCQ